MTYELNINNIEETKKLISGAIAKMVNADDIKINEIFYYTGLKKWSLKISYSSAGKTYYGSMDINCNGTILRYQEREV
ncbi:hypothetical protein [Acidiplasma cupricumulans]|jgi:hypothetical protein|uniref:Uncharacterized protein n=1 Tax=Acidiplasma cupricumulans TaxID=312540 RepID=A0A0Q0WJL2_9ARCH|nr:hypothetical protein [Acidiplasma cupricumulans]KQB35842.1 hypothetical protein AOG55_00445 [Acidiplasma cupricumulans]